MLLAVFFTVEGSLASLWEKYEKEAEKDRVQKMADILEDIKSKALKERIAWDYYRACRLYVDVKASRNWKLRAELMDKLNDEIQSYGEPVLEYLLMREKCGTTELLAFVREHKDELEAGLDRNVYQGAGMVYAKALIPLVKNNWEYVLWDIFDRTQPYDDECPAVYQILSEAVGDAYPKSAVAEFVCLRKKAERYPENSGSGQKADLQDFAERYAGKALGVMAQELLVRLELAGGNAEGDPERFRSMREHVVSLIKERDGFRSGTEKALAEYCTGLEDILAHLDAQVAFLEIHDGDVQVALRNLDKVKVRVLRDKKQVYETVLQNPVCSYYVLDTLNFTLPELEDGEYVLECYSGMTKIGETTFPKYTLSMAVRTSAEGTSVYVADYFTGQPMDCVDLVLYKGNRKVEEYHGLRLDGYTRLPSSIESSLNQVGAHVLECVVKEPSGMARRVSRYIYRGGGSGAEIAATVHASVLLDKPAYNPDETVRFKAVIYGKNVQDGSMYVMPSGREYVVNVLSPDREVVASMQVVTNDFGSVCGEFSLQKLARYGRCVLEIREGSALVGLCRFVVDEYVLPTFDVTFDEPEKVFMSGDEVAVSGVLKSFAGHSLSSAKVEAVVELDGEEVLRQGVSVAADGAFAVSFKDVPREGDRVREYSIEVKVTDLTGETLTFRHKQMVMVVPYLRVSLKNEADGKCRLTGSDTRASLLADDVAYMLCEAGYQSYDLCNGLPVGYRLVKDGETLLKGYVLSGDDVRLDMSGLSSGLYEFVLTLDLKDTEGKPVRGKVAKNIYKLPSGGTDVFVPESVQHVFHASGDEDISLGIGAGEAPLWAVVELFGDRKQLLKSEIVYVGKGSMKTVHYDYLDAYPDGVRMNVLYFRKGYSYEYTREWRRPVQVSDIPLTFSRFADRLLPGTVYSVSLQTVPGVESVAAVYDASADKVFCNPWKPVSRAHSVVSVVSVITEAGEYGRRYRSVFGDQHAISMYGPLFDAGVSLEEDIVVGYGTRVNSVMRSKSSASVESEVIPFQWVNDSAGAVSEEALPQVTVREDFSTSLAFEPLLYPSEDGEFSFDFKTSDKISTFVVTVFAHDKSMNSVVVRKEMVVSLPVKVAVVQPQYLYVGDRYVLNATVSNISEEAVSGEAVVEVYAGAEYEGAEPMARSAVRVDVPVGGVASVPFEMTVPSDVDTLGFKVVFADGQVSDGLFVTIPVYEASQVIREAHSAVLLSGMSEEELLKVLRGRFVNGSSLGAEYKSVSIMDMLRSALPLVVEAEDKDAVSQSVAMYVNLLAAGLRAADGDDVRLYAEAFMNAVSALQDCADEDGGFAWFEGMKPSPIITAVVLERYAGLRDRGLLTLVSETLGEDALDAFDEAVTASVKYLDSVYFKDKDRPVWCGPVSLWQYLNLRSKYSGVPFDAAQARKNVGSRDYREFKSYVKEYLTPGKDEMWTKGAVLAKVRMLRVLNDLSSSEAGVELAKAWGISAGRTARMRRSMKKELASLKEYAVDHPSGGIYYPNAVLPWRGLLESEAYAHALLCDLCRDMSSDPELGEGLAELADGIRIWVMLQKETQEWSSDPGFVDAMASVYDGSAAVKDTRVTVLSKRFLKPFCEIVAAGNGMEVSVSCFRDGKPLQEDDTLHVGDKVVAKYELWSAENRSFVRLSVPRAACMRPADQLSGWSWGWYREARADRTLYWIDVFPEENTTMEEVFFVTQEGTFTCPAAEIESLYAPHYRANAAWPGLLYAVPVRGNG